MYEETRWFFSRVPSLNSIYRTRLKRKATALLHQPRLISCTIIRTSRHRHEHIIRYPTLHVQHTTCLVIALSRDRTRSAGRATFNRSNPHTSERRMFRNNQTKVSRTHRPTFDNCKVCNRKNHRTMDCFHNQPKSLWTRDPPSLSFI